MRPLRLLLDGFGSYREPADIDFTGVDFFAVADICSIVLELPNTALGPGAVQLWAVSHGCRRAICRRFCGRHSARAP